MAAPYRFFLNKEDCHILFQTFLMWSNLWITLMMNVAKLLGNARGAIKFAN